MIIIYQNSMDAASLDYNEIEQSNTAKLKKELSKLNTELPEIDIDTNIRKNDYRFICVCTYSCAPPSVELKDYYLTEKYGQRCLDGTTDVVEGEKHIKLIVRASKYAEKYNTLLLKKLKEKLNKKP
jgi:hypothetical protein